MDFPGDSDSEESACSAGDPGSITASGRSPGEGSGYPLQYSCLENSMNRGTFLSYIIRTRSPPPPQHDLWILRGWRANLFHFFVPCVPNTVPDTQDKSAIAPLAWKKTGSVQASPSLWPTHPPTHTSQQGSVHCEAQGQLRGESSSERGPHAPCTGPHGETSRASAVLGKPFLSNRWGRGRGWSLRLQGDLLGKGWPAFFTGSRCLTLFLGNEFHCKRLGVADWGTCSNRDPNEALHCKTFLSLQIHILCFQWEMESRAVGFWGLFISRKQVDGGDGWWWIHSQTIAIVCGRAERAAAPRVPGLPWAPLHLGHQSGQTLRRLPSSKTYQKDINNQPPILQLDYKKHAYALCRFS